MLVYKTVSQYACIQVRAPLRMPTTLPAPLNKMNTCCTHQILLLVAPPVQQQLKPGALDLDGSFLSSFFHALPNCSAGISLQMQA